MSAQEKAVIKAMRRHQRDGRRFRDLLVHCACGWKSPALKARKGSNDFALAREDQAKSFERHVAREVLAATAAPESAGLLARLSASGGRNIDLLKRAQNAEAVMAGVRELHKPKETSVQRWQVTTNTQIGPEWVTVLMCTGCSANYPCPTINALEGTK